MGGVIIAVLALLLLVGALDGSKGIYITFLVLGTGNAILWLYRMADR